MIPRFIIKNYTDDILLALKNFGYSYTESSHPESLLVIGKSILKAPAEEKNQLIKIYDCSKFSPYVVTDKEPLKNEILYQAFIHMRWQEAGKPVEVIVSNKKLPVHVTNVGVLIDSFVVGIYTFKSALHSFRNFNPPSIVTHKPVIKPDVYFLTVGCAEYSLNDMQKIVDAFSSLL